MSKRRRDTGSPYLQTLSDDETMTNFHKLLLKKFDSIISLLQRLDEKVYSIDKRLSYLESKENEQMSKVEEEELPEITEELVETRIESSPPPPPLKQAPAPLPPMLDHLPIHTSSPLVSVPVQKPAPVESLSQRFSINDLPSTSATIVKEEYDDDESSQSIMEIEDLQNLAAKSEAIEIDDVSYILPESSLNDTSSSYMHHERESYETSNQVFPQGSFNCLVSLMFFFYTL